MRAIIKLGEYEWRHEFDEHLLKTIKCPEDYISLEMGFGLESIIEAYKQKLEVTK